MIVLSMMVRERLRSTLSWAAGVASMTALIFLYWPSVRDNPELERFARDLPEAVRAITGEGSLTTPHGYLNAELCAFMVPLLFLVVAVSAGARAIAGEQDRGTLELLLSMPVSRRRVVLEKAAAICINLVTLGGALLVTLLVGVALSDMSIGAGRLAATALSVVALSLVYGALALALGCATGRRAVASGVTTTVAVAAYLLDALAPLSETLRPFGSLSPFRWYASDVSLAAGPQWGDLALLTGTAAVLTVIAIATFERRDVV